MTKNPLLNALAAALYIVAVAAVMYYGPKVSAPRETVVVPIAVLLLFTLSAAVMGYLFLYQPLQLYLDGAKQAAARLFIQTVGVFAAMTALLLLMLFSGIVF